MSAWLCSQRHIGAIADAASRLGAGDYDEIGERLLRENHRSLGARYSDEDPGEPFAFAFPNDHRPTLPEIVKLCDCFDYQACETSDYEGTEAAANVELVRADALKRLRWTGRNYRTFPEWEAADWGDWR